MNSFLPYLSFYKEASEQADLSFLPDYTPEDLRRMGVYEEVYDRTKPRLASLNSWPEHWFHPEDKMGWLEWYKKYNSGRRMEDDKRQIKRWIAFKARHGGKAFQENPTPRRAYALRNWAIDPAKLVKDPEALKVVMDEYKQKQYSKSMDKLSYLNWYGAETSNYVGTGKPGVYHSIPIRDSDEVGWFQNPKKSIPRSKFEKIIEELSKLEGVDVNFFPPAEYEGELGFGWTVDKNRGYADKDMAKKIDEILYGEKMDKVSFLPKLAKDKKPGLWENIRAKKQRGEKPAKPGDKDFPDKEQWNKLTKQSSDLNQLKQYVTSGGATQAPPNLYDMIGGAISKAQSSAYTAGGKGYELYSKMKNKFNSQPDSSGVASLNKPQLKKESNQNINKKAAELSTSIPGETPEALYERIMAKNLNVNQFFQNATKHNWKIPGVPGFLARTVARKAQQNPDPYLESLRKKVPKTTIIDAIKNNPDAFKNVSNKVNSSNNIS